jgi:hypothetical protein
VADKLSIPMMQLKLAYRISLWPVKKKNQVLTTAAQYIGMMGEASKEISGSSKQTKKKELRVEIVDLGEKDRAKANSKPAKGSKVTTSTSTSQ